MAKNKASESIWLAIQLAVFSQCGKANGNYVCLRVVAVGASQTRNKRNN
jgi:hypothetical protein